MNSLADTLLLLAIGYLGMWAFKKLRFPSPQVLGPMAFIAMVNIFGLYAFPNLPKSFISTFFTIGVAISICNGFHFTKDEGWGQMIIVIVVSTLLGTVCGLGLKSFGMDSITALFSAIPGGGSDLGLIALSYEKADPFNIVLYQTIRYFLVIFSYPFIIRWICKREEKKGSALLKDFSQNKNSSGNNYPGFSKPSHTFAALGLTFIVGWILANLLNKIHLSGATYVGGLIATIMLNEISRRSWGKMPTMNRSWSTFFKVGAMAYMGLSITKSSLISFIHDWPAVVFSCLFIMGVLILLGYWFYKKGYFDLTTSLLCTAPGGVVPMAVLSDEMKGDSVKVALFQLTRIVFLVLLAPIIGDRML